jgi:hypothetical protein
VASLKLFEYLRVVNIVLLLLPQLYVAQELFFLPRRVEDVHQNFVLVQHIPSQVIVDVFNEIRVNEREEFVTILVDLICLVRNHISWYILALVQL